MWEARGHRNGAPRAPAKMGAIAFCCRPELAGGNLQKSSSFFDYGANGPTFEN